MAWPGWTGVGERRWKTAPNEQVQPGKTLWDLLQLLIVPVILVGVTFVWSASQTKSENRREDRRLEADRVAAEQARQNTTLDAYIEQMSKLMLDKKLLTSERHEAVRPVARTITLTTLRRLDGRRKGVLVTFLKEAGLLDARSEFVYSLDLFGADLRFAVLTGARLFAADLVGADLRNAELAGADLAEADLAGANLSGASLAGARLGGALLQGTTFKDADLRRTDLAGAAIESTNFAGADLRGADLRNTDLRFIDFTGADLRGADLRDLDLSSTNLTDAAVSKGPPSPKGRRAPPSHPPQGPGAG